MHFRDPAAKFSSNLGESWSEYVAEIKQVARDYELAASQKLQDLQNPLELGHLLRGDAKRFFFDRVHGTAATLAQAVDVVSTKYNSIVRQGREKNYLSSLRLSSFVNDETNVTAAPEKTQNTISKLAPQVHRTHHGESYEVEFLRNAVVGNNWATEPLSCVATHLRTFQQLYGALEAALYLRNKAPLAVMGTEVGHGPWKLEDKVQGILFAGHGRYGRKKKSVAKRFDSSKSNGGCDPLFPIGCFNSDDRSHSLDECPHHVSAIKATNRKVEYFAEKGAERPAASVILYQPCAQLDAAGVTGDEDDDANEESDEAIEAAASEVGISQAGVDGSEPVPMDGDGTTSDDPDFA
eukprot:contig_11560_g2759